MGGGGYDIWRVVPRAWSHIWLEMMDKNNVLGALPETWLSSWKAQSPVELPQTWEDREDIYQPIPRKQEISEKNKQVLLKALYPISHLRNGNTHIG